MNDEYRLAAKARDEARKRLNLAERAMWDAEREWEDAERRVQRAFVALVNGQSAPKTD